MDKETKQNSEVGDGDGVGVTCVTCGHIHNNPDGSCACGCAEPQKK